MPSDFNKGCLQKIPTDLSPGLIKWVQKFAKGCIKKTPGIYDIVPFSPDTHPP